MAESHDSSSSEHGTTGGDTAKLAVAWMIVGVPLVYGVVLTINKAIPLFTG